MMSVISVEACSSAFQHDCLPKLGTRISQKSFRGIIRILPVYLAVSSASIAQSAVVKVAKLSLCSSTTTLIVALTVYAITELKEAVSFALSSILQAISITTDYVPYIKQKNTTTKTIAYILISLEALVVGVHMKAKRSEQSERAGGAKSTLIEGMVPYYRPAAVRKGSYQV